MRISSPDSRRADRVGLALGLGLALASVAGCGAAGSPPATAAGDDGSPVELRLRTHDGGVIDLARLRGAPVLLFVFATYDGASQASVRSLSLLMHDFPDTQVVGIAAQEGADELVDAWAYAMAPPFPVAYDPAARVATGQSDLGAIEAVPTFVALDARGVEVERKVGFLSEGELVSLMQRASGERHAR